MPHVSSGGGEDLASSDELKVYKDEGGEEKQSSENLSEDKLGLVTESEEGKGSEDGGQSTVSNTEPVWKKGCEVSQVQNLMERLWGKPPDPIPMDRLGPFPYLVTPYPYPNGATLGPLGNKMSVMQSPFPPYLTDHLSPPPAHMGYPPVIDPKTGLPRPPMYPLPPPPGQFPHPLYPTELSQVQWNGPGGYPITTSGFRSPYPSSLPPNSMLARFSPSGLLHPGMAPHPGLPHPAIVTPGPKHDISHGHDIHRHSPASALDHSVLNGSFHDPSLEEASPSKKNKTHIKKPLNAFMLFMREMRPQVMAETSIKESAAINQILGRKWHALDRSEQAKYYEMARKEKELHMQLYPGWSARDSYATHAKRKAKRKREPTGDKGADDCNNPKKCRARFGLDSQNQWCKPCRSDSEDTSEHSQTPSVIDHSASVDSKPNLETTTTEL